MKKILNESVIFFLLSYLHKYCSKESVLSESEIIEKLGITQSELVIYLKYFHSLGLVDMIVLEHKEDPNSLHNLGDRYFIKELFSPGLALLDQISTGANCKEMNSVTSILEAMKLEAVKLSVKKAFESAELLGDSYKMLGA